MSQSPAPLTLAAAQVTLGILFHSADSVWTALILTKMHCPLQRRTCQKNSFYASDIFNSIPRKKYDLITFDIPFFPEEKNTGKKALGNFITLFHLESFILPLLRKAFPDKNRKRRDFIARVAKESRVFLRPNGNLIIDIFEDEFPAVSKYLRIDKNEEMFRNHFIICASLKGRY